MKTMKKVLIFAIILSAYTFVMHITGIGCPFKWLTGISCPGCGLSRSVVCARQLDFAGMVENHALMPLIVGLFIFILIFEDKCSKKVKNIVYISCLSSAMIYYIYRMFILQSDVLQFNIYDGVMYKIINTIASF